MAVTVTMTRDLRPYRAGDSATFQDASLAAKLVASGEAKDLRPYPPVDVAPAVPVGTLSLSRKSYLTRTRTGK